MFDTYILAKNSRFHSDQVLIKLIYNFIFKNWARINCTSKSIGKISKFLNSLTGMAFIWHFYLCFKYY